MTIIFTKIFTVRIEFLDKTDRGNYILTLKQVNDYSLSYDAYSENDKVLYNGKLLIPGNKFNKNSENYLLLPTKKGDEIKEKLIPFDNIREFLLKVNGMFQKFYLFSKDPISLGDLTMSDVLDHRPWRKVAQIFAKDFELSENLFTYQQIFIY